MEFQKTKIGSANYIMYYKLNAESNSLKTVLDSWGNNTFSFPKMVSGVTSGFRSAQLGAIYSIKSHWTVSSEPATIVMPTGTGKTEVMIATVISEQCHRTCVVVPSKLLRDQTAERFCTLAKLREIGAINEQFLNPIVGVLVATPKSTEELNEIVDNSNVIITTMSLLSQRKFIDNYIKILDEVCDAFIIDEAHHVPAKKWTAIKGLLSNAKCLQFTATPFRNDGKKIDGDIIFDFPLGLAQEEGYFKKIKFYPVYEFDDDKKDLSVARKAVDILKEDLRKGFSHLLLVRAASQQRARFLYENIYGKYFLRYSPVLVISGKKAPENKLALQKVKEGNSKIIVCVDMFSEGIDIPQLKICAIHDKYKSLPITIQFVGRFARTQHNLGEASIVANIVDKDIEESLESLYSQDADWNIIIKDATENLIENEVKLQKLANGFTGSKTIPIKQIKPKISMFMFKTNAKKWNWNNWRSVFDEENCHHYINHDKKILIITELTSSYVEWTTIRDISDKNWNLHIIYWNEKKNIFFINTTEKGIVNKLAQAIFDDYKPIRGEKVFRCLHGINRLMLSSVGLRNAAPNSKHICYRMFAGVDVAEGITNAVTGNSVKSNLFGIGYENGKKVSIGCSYRGTIWSRWIENIDYWCEWCNAQAEKILNDSISTSEVLSHVLVPEVINKWPTVIPYRIDLPEELFMSNNWYVGMEDEQRIGDNISLEIKITASNENAKLSFSVGNDSIQEKLNLDIDNEGYRISHESGPKFNIYFGRSKHLTLRDYLQDNPPIVWFVDGSSLEGNLLVRLKDALPIEFSREHIVAWEWVGIDIKKESQGKEKYNESIQYHVIDILRSTGKYCIIFDDDGSGEIADVIAIGQDELSKKIIFELYHCKYSHGDSAGARLSDLYELCGQADKCIRWFVDAKAILERMVERHKRSLKNRGVSRFEIGDEKLLYQLKNELRFYRTEFSVYIVQPGIDSKKITPQMHQVLCSSQSYLQDTYSIPLTLICS